MCAREREKRWRVRDGERETEKNKAWVDGNHECEGK